MSDTHRTLKCVDPASRALAVQVNEQSFVSTGGTVPAEGTLYSDAAFKTMFGADYRQNFSSYVYLGQGEDWKGGGTLLFGKGGLDRNGNPTSDPSAIPPFRTTTRFGNHYWHPILKELKFIPVQGFPLNTYSSGSIAYAQRYMVREVYIPSVNEGTRFVIEEFLSPIPFQIPKTPTPQPSSVSYSFINIRGGFPECLHEKLDINALLGVGTAGLPGQIFPATNFTDWVPYILSDTQELTAGGYHRIRTRVYPPSRPKALQTVTR